MGGPEVVTVVCVDRTNMVTLELCRKKNWETVGFRSCDPKKGRPMESPL